MKGIRQYFEDHNIVFSIRLCGFQNIASWWEINEVIENQDVFGEIYEKYSLTDIESMDDFFLYMLSLKFSALRSIAPHITNAEQRLQVIRLSDAADALLQMVCRGNVIKYINSHIADLFDDDASSYEIRFATLDYIARYSSGMDKQTFEFLCKNYGYLMLDRFDDFEIIFEKYSTLFDYIFPTGSLKEIDGFRISTVLDIWSYIYCKRTSNLKKYVEQYIPVLFDDIKCLAEAATISNVMQIDDTVRKFYLFLKKIQSPKANEFSRYAKVTEELLIKHVHENGQVFKSEIPVNEILNQWRIIENWQVRLLYLTHRFEHDNNSILANSKLSVAPEPRTLTDMCTMNIPTDEYFTASHQRRITNIVFVGSGTVYGILMNTELLIDYLNLVSSAINVISEVTACDDDHLVADAQLLINMLRILADNVDLGADTINALCYGAAMFLCAFAEKLVRILFLYMIREQAYIPVEKATLGELLNPNNEKIAKVFGTDHMRNLAFFLLQVSPHKVGCNLRNSLAHWSNMTRESLNLQFVSKLLWLFTDILNTVFFYCLKQSFFDKN